MFQSDLLQEKVVVVTGGGTGLGRSMAARIGELGGKLVLASRRREVLEEAAREFERNGTETFVHPCDVRDPEQVDRLFAAAVDRFGRVDALINNAAGNFLCKTEELSPNGFDAIVRIVLYGTFHCSRAFGRHVIERGGGGTILNIVTTYAWTGSAFVVPSAAAKAGVLAMTRSLAVEWARHGIRVNAVAPGPFPTEGAWKALVPTPEAEAMARNRIPLRRFGDHAELANLVCYLLADESAYVTGEVVTIDGGEWLMGGEFNGLTQLPPETIDAIFDAIRAARRRP